jgi:Zn-dependent protease with chaperone function
MGINAKDFARDMAKEKVIEDQLMTIDPSVVETFKAGTAAMDNKDLKLADSLYTIVFMKAPNFDPLLRRLGVIKTSLGMIDEGIELSRRAVDINKSAYNLLSLATGYFTKGSKEATPNSDLGKALEYLKEAETLPDGDDFDIVALKGQIAMQQDDVIELRRATEKLLASYPDEMFSHYSAAVLAAVDSKWAKAKKEILIAEKLGLPSDITANFLASGVEKKAGTGHIIHIFIWVTVAWAAGLLLLFLLGIFMSDSTLRSIEKQKGTQLVSENEQRLRALYRRLINLGGVYYYISLPIVLVLVIGLVAALFYAFLYMGRIPIKLMIILGIGAVVTIYSMIRSLFVKVKYDDPGRRLSEEEAPGLFTLTREVAATTGTRPIDEIRITPATDMAVYERGSWRDKLNDKANRILIVGTAILKDFRQDEFRAVLAHEYGHFSHRDTAGGEVALRVRNDINKYFYALYMAGQNLWYNVAFQFLRLYNFIFIRISHGSSRLQEVLADRVAASVYGKNAFKEGLIHVIRKDIEFSHYANAEIEAAKKGGRTVNNLYNLPADHGTEIDEELTKALSAKTTGNDTHPAPNDRFRYVEMINSQSVPSDSRSVHELFANWDALTAEMTETITKRVASN